MPQPHYSDQKVGRGSIFGPSAGLLLDYLLIRRRQLELPDRLVGAPAALALTRRQLSATLIVPTSPDGAVDARN